MLVKICKTEDATHLHKSPRQSLFSFNSGPAATILSLFSIIYAVMGVLPEVLTEVKPKVEQITP